MTRLISAPAARPVSLTLRLALAACFVSSATAQTVVVTGSREPLPLDRVTSDVVLIDAERIRASTADSVEDLLRREAGVQVSRNGGTGKSASVFIRGAGSSNTVVLIDGVRIGSGTLGQVEFEALSLSQIERIEVLRGPGSSLYGADAVGGVIQIFTRTGKSGAGTTFDADAAVGGYGARKGSVAVTGASGLFDYAASLGHERDEGVSSLREGDRFGNYNPDRDGHRRTSGTLKLGITPVEGHRVGLLVTDTRLRSQYDGSEYLAPDFAQDASGDMRNHLDTRVVSLDYRGRLGAAWTTSVQIAHSDDDLRSGDRAPDRYRTRRNQLTWQNAWTPDGDTQVVVAFERLVEKADASTYLGSERRSNNALVLGWSGRFGAHTLQADLRHDDSSVYGGNSTGRLGWRMSLAPAWSVRALAGTTFRAPSFNDLYYPDYGVPTIEAERGRSIEAGVEWRRNGSEAGLTVYRNRVKNLVAYQPDAAFCPPGPGYQYGCAGNVGRATLEGATLTAAHRLGALQLRATVDFLDAIDDGTGNRLTRRAAHQESLSADLDLGRWAFGASLLSVGARPDGNVNLGAYALLDLSARWRFAPQWQLEAKVLNATDKQYEPAREYQALGRQAWIGLRYSAKML
ncbi:TonB-dependent receptor domain-containing protein [Aquincola tertiaricarbonis]|uniref:TonB-dependent receptor domain-containing protein n=1 Tax=Aquincola tertiaricarbonis TaxID=391953 RepID=UPI00061527EB|nr:TonB-dependent receptor [Aquincola tertiaricarbonis]